MLLTPEESIQIQVITFFSQVTFLGSLNSFRVFHANVSILYVSFMLKKCDHNLFFLFGDFEN